MKIVINNVEFPFDLGCRVLKLKYQDECPMEQLEDFWDKVVPATFGDIAQLPNLEQRRVGILNLGMEAIIKEAKPTLLSSKTIKKTTTWVNEKGELVEHTFDDTYELFEVKGEVFSQNMENSWRKMEDCHYVRCKDTSTDREYLIWVDLRSVYSTNELGSNWDFDMSKINPIHCIAWTIQTDVPQGNIAKIVRQGDCVMIKPKGTYTPLDKPRHLTEKEYLKLIVAES
jgi:hypothetical protein